MKRGQLTKELILDEALTITTQSGLAGLTYNGLARAMGIKPQSMYRYLANITEVKAGVVALYLQQLCDYLAREVAPLTGKVAARTVAKAFVQFTIAGVSFTDMVSGIGSYHDQPEIMAAMDQLRSIILRCVATATADDTKVAGNMTLLLDFIVGHLALSAAQRMDQNSTANFDDTLDRVLSLF